MKGKETPNTWRQCEKPLLYPFSWFSPTLSPKQSHGGSDRNFRFHSIGEEVIPSKWGNTSIVSYSFSILLLLGSRYGQSHRYVSERITKTLAIKPESQMRSPGELNQTRENVKKGGSTRIYIKVQIKILRDFLNRG